APARDPGAEVPPSSTAPPAAPRVSPEDGVICRDEQPVVDLLPWADLGLTPEQVAVAQGQTHLFATDADGGLVSVETLDGTSAYVDPQQQRLLAADDGFWLVAETTLDDDDPSDDMAFDQVGWHSVDGQAWTSTPLTTGRSILTVGVTGGRPVLVTAAPGPDQEVEVHRVEAGGAVTTVDVNDLIDVPRGSGIYAYAVGPLGVAIVLGQGPGGVDEDPVLVHSLDGLQFSRQALPAADPGTRESVNGITITPDAVKVRLNVRDEGDLTGGSPAAQRLFVGTPAG
ncbi:MAG TPA: hypothetical protein VGO60_17935, partial [Iamia sp.]|nr:hypothetical protein [Iamia sp.]